MNVIAELQVPPLFKDGQAIACPVCGQDDDLTLIIDSQDFSETAALLRCDDAHQWAEPRVPRRIGAELLAIRARERPDLIDWSEAQRL
ncbi:hypothetical protein AQI95_21190 [Streptomyces yokosukanensis]|uniref:Uncharacterized protein n=1 Tax=Streptomyces yokosukanensis TaxID=67386 RepID=A0A117Q1S4_9ACTN|nr:hypothetical protein [Streptomyces yokosukanensis]KUN03957.1 hypothetical protein AQI95_21190 [Streptomyces yokosukanensis]